MRRYVPDPSRLLPVGILLVALGLALSGVAVAADSPAGLPPGSVLAPLLLGLLAFAVGWFVGQP